MKKFVLALAAFAVIGIAAPVASANAETVVVKHRDHDRDWGRHHHKKVIIIKRGHRHD